jgi:hypothetical protein
MARFIIAHLRDGAYKNRPILRPETVRVMHARQFAQLADTSGWAYGLWEDTRDGYRALLHNGGAKGCRALLYLLPQQDAGFFLAYNLADQHHEGELLEAFITEFRRRLLPAPRSSVGQMQKTSAGQFVGDYLYVRRSRTTLEKMISALNQVRVTTDGSGNLILSGRSIGQTPLAPIGPQRFQRADGHGLVAFDSASPVSTLLVAITDSGFPAVYERIPLYATMRVQLVWVVAMTLAFLYAGVWRPAAAMFPRARQIGWDSPGWWKWLSGVASALNLLFLAGFPLAFLGRIEGGVPEFLYGVPAAAACLLFIPPFTATLAIGTTLAAAAVWRNARTSTAARIEHSLVASALIGFVVFTWYWKLLPARLQ